jgi:hypothetical protein
MRKAFIDQILLGFVLFSGIFILIATVNDDTMVRNKYYNLKKLTDQAALSAAKYYNINKDTINAEKIAKDMLSETKLGLEIKDNITFSWDFINNPNNVIASISNYKENLFWYRLLSLNSFNFEKIESKADLIPSTLTSTSNFAPLAINQCNRDDLINDAELTFEFHSYSEFDNNDKKGFYGVTSECENPTGNAFFAHYKNEFNNPSFNDNNTFLSGNSLDLQTDTLCLPQTDFQNPNTVDPKQLYNKLVNFPIGSKLQIALLDCNSTAANLNVSSLLTVELMNTPTCTQGTWSHSEDWGDSNNWDNSEDWDSRVWNEQSNTCNGGNYDYKLLTIDLKVIDENKVILEY